MRAVIQRVLNASVSINKTEVSAIKRGLLVLLGIHQDDSIEKVDPLADKVIKLRIFPDDEGKMNRSLEDIDGEILVVSQFTLYGDSSRGRRPSFTQAARPEQAIPIYEAFKGACRERLNMVKSGEFGANMQVHLVNDGPVTLVIDL